MYALRGIIGRAFLTGKQHSPLRIVSISRYTPRNAPKSFVRTPRVQHMPSIFQSPGAITSRRCYHASTTTQCLSGSSIASIKLPSLGHRFRSHHDHYQQYSQHMRTYLMQTPRSHFTSIAGGTPPAPPAPPIPPTPSIPSIPSGLMHQLMHRLSSPHVKYIIGFAAISAVLAWSIPYYIEKAYSKEMTLMRIVSDWMQSPNDYFQFFMSANTLFRIIVFSTFADPRLIDDGGKLAFHHNSLYIPGFPSLGKQISAVFSQHMQELAQMDTHTEGPTPYFLQLMSFASQLTPSLSAALLEQFHRHQLTTLGYDTGFQLLDELSVMAITTPQFLDDKLVPLIRQYGTANGLRCLTKNKYEKAQHQYRNMLSTFLDSHFNEVSARISRRIAQRPSLTRDQFRSIYNAEWRKVILPVQGPEGQTYSALEFDEAMETLTRPILEQIEQNPDQNYPVASFYDILSIKAHERLRTVLDQHLAQQLFPYYATPPTEPQAKLLMELYMTTLLRTFNMMTYIQTLSSQDRQQFAERSPFNVIPVDPKTPEEKIIYDQFFEFLKLNRSVHDQFELFCSTFLKPNVYEEIHQVQFDRPLVPGPERPLQYPFYTLALESSFIPVQFRVAHQLLTAYREKRGGAFYHLVQPNATEDDVKQYYAIDTELTPLQKQLFGVEPIQEPSPRIKEPFELDWSEISPLVALPKEHLQGYPATTHYMRYQGSPTEMNMSQSFAVLMYLFDQSILSLLAELPAIDHHLVEYSKSFVRLQALRSTLSQIQQQQQDQQQQHEMASDISDIISSSVAPISLLDSYPQDMTEADDLPLGVTQQQQQQSIMDSSLDGFDIPAHELTLETDDV